MPSLLIKEGPLAGERLEIDSEVVLGREGADVVVDDPELSRRHAVLRPVDGALEVEDLNSLNGTWVNGRRITGPAKLEAGDLLRFGATVLEVPPTPQRAAETMASPRATVAAQETIQADLGVLVLHVTAGPLAGERLDVGSEIVLGREGTDVVLNDEEVSRRHAALRPSNRAFEVEDLGSLNGTWVNGDRISGSVGLNAGDIVRLGSTEIEVQRERDGLRETALRPAPQPGRRRERPDARRLSPEALARAASRRPWVVVGSWIGAVVLAVVLIVLLLGDALTSDQRLTNNPESLRATDLVDTKFDRGNVATDLVIVRSESLDVDDTAFRQKVQRVAASLVATDAVQNARTFYASRDASLVSDNRRATLVPLVLEPGADEDEALLTELIDVVEASSDQRLEVTITGEAAFDNDLGTLAQSDLKEGELFFGGPAALVILVLVFGAVVAGLIPLLMAIVSIVATLALVSLLGNVFEISLFVVNMVTGMGLALGIDYSLFILSRYREERREGRDKLEAIAAAGATASRAVLFSGLAFVLALLGMLLVPDLILRSLAAGAIVVGFVSVVAALTLLPAVLALLGDRINSLRVPFVGRSAGEGTQEGRFWGAIVRGVMRRPVLSLTVSVALLLAAAIPILDYETGFAGTSTLPDDVPSKQGFLALQESFPGTTAEPALVVITAAQSAPGVRPGVDRLRRLVAQDKIFGKPTVQRARTGDATLVEMPVAGDSQDDRAIDAVKKLRDEYVPQAFPNASFEILVGGQTAETIDYTQTTGAWLPRVFAFVLGLSFVLLMLAFRSIVVPLKAIVLNLLSVGAAYGLLVLVFVKGVGADLLGFQQVDTIVAWVPLFLFSVLFGLSMDYHVFLLSRIRERFLQDGDNDRAVEHGVSSTARLITGAALIIIAVFGGFAMGDLVMFQQMGFGIGVALFIDATIIRSVLVPASMKLLGARNWYLPEALRWLPDVAVEGTERRGTDATKR